jgi:hypothetical protein
MRLMPVFDSFDRIGDNQILVQLTAGETKLAYVIPTGNLVDSVRLAVDCMNRNLAATMRDTGMV